MCGIAGSLIWDRGRDSAVSAEQARLLHHRGPDSSGSFDAGSAVITQSRLAIIDLVTGDPPILNEDGTVGAVLNGEIYNFAELRQALRRHGHQLATQGDTEVLVHLAEEVSPVELAQHLLGMFAFAVWDAARERLVLGRDRAGKKPLFYWQSDSGVVFGSEIKAVLAHPSVPRTLDPAAIPGYLTFGYVPTPRTFFAGIRSLPPAHVLVVDRSGAHVLPYWSLPIPGVDVDPIDLSLGDAAREVRAVLEAAVQRRMVADVPLGAFLSGGVDSAAVSAIMARVSDRPVRTFTMGFEVPEFDERERARLIARHIGSQHTEFVVKPDAVDLVERLVWHHDQPFGDSSAIPMYLLARETRQHVTVALSGDGGDELFAGYERFAAALAVESYRRVPDAARRAVDRALGALPNSMLRGRGPSLLRFTSRADMGLPGAYRSWISYVSDDRRNQLLGDLDDWADTDYDDLWRSSDGARLLDRLLNLNFRTYLLDDLLVKADRMSMAHGLEVRSPFLDTDLIELAMRLPPSVKARGLSLKRVAKEAVRDLVPPEILTGRKRGFGVPLDRWFRSDLRLYVESMLGARDARVRQHLSPAALDQLLSEHAAEKRNHGHALWALLTLEVFLRREGW